MGNCSTCPRLQCDCGYKCPYGKCFDCCKGNHYQDHRCSKCIKCPIYNKCQTCKSTTYCSGCCGCYKKQQRIQQQQEKERQEKLRQQQEKERQEKQQQEKERQEKQQQEKERQEKLSQQQEKERQEKQQQEKEREEVLRKLTQGLADAPTAEENISHLIQNKSNITDQTKYEDTCALSFNLLDINQTIDLDSDTRSLSRWSSSDSILSLYESCEEFDISETNNDDDDSLFSLDSNRNSFYSICESDEEYDNQETFNECSSGCTNSNSAPEKDLESSKPKGKLGSIFSKFVSWIFKNTNVDQKADSSHIATFLTNYTTNLSPEEEVNFYQTIGNFIANKLPQVDAKLQQSIIDYFTDENQLYAYVVQHYPVAEWIKQSLIKEVVAYDDEDDYCLKSFRFQWLEITKKYSIFNQVDLLKALKSKKYSSNLSLLDINNILRLILHTGSAGYNIVCDEQYKDSYLDLLKTNWLKSKLEICLPKFSESNRLEIGSRLADMDWSIDMMEQFLKSIQYSTRLDPILTVLSTIKNYDVSDTLVLSINMQDLNSAGEKELQQWTHTIVCQTLMNKIEKLSAKTFKYIGSSLINLLEPSCPAELLAMINQHENEFTKVLELLFDYQVREEVFASALSLLTKKEKLIFSLKSTDWVNKVDQFVSCKLFGDAKVYSTDEVIERIVFDGSSIKSTELKASYDEVMKSYRSPSVAFSKPISKWNKTEVLSWSKKVKSSATSNSSIAKSELIAGVMRAVELNCCFQPRDTQIMSLIALLNHDDGVGRLAQINTGEGKSLIVAMLAAICALQSKKVDVITTSTELSIPEVKRQKPFFESLSLTVAENSLVSAKRSAYKNDILYGISGDFQADILRTEFMGQYIRGDRGFNIVIVDEVDSMLFDNRSYSVRLSEQTPGMTHLELPLAAIWEYIQGIVIHMTTVNDQTYFITEDFERKGDEIKLYSDQNWESCAVPVKDKRTFIVEHTQTDLKQLLRELSDEEKSEYAKYRQLCNQISTLESDISNTSETKDKEQEQQEQIKIALRESLSVNLKALPWTQRYPVLDVPIHLRNFARSQIPCWIDNAINAAYGYKKDAHYTVQNGRIVPVHFNETGVLQSNMVWGDGLTQFLQLKEGLRMTPEGIATNFISNVGFFQRYGSHIYGLTGTLGENSTKAFLRQVYNTDTVVIPPHQYREIKDNSHSTYLCKELAPIVLSSEITWFETTIQRSLIHAKQKRAVLIICKYIKHVTYLNTELRKRYDAGKIFIYTGEDESFEKTTIDSGEIIMATNIAGRGMDLKTTESVESHGGLYVTVTFLPESYRVEMQNVGRTARSGKKGMAQLIIYDPLACNIIDVKKNRDQKEVLATEKAIHDAQKMLLQDRLFSEFCSLEDKLLSTASACYSVQKWEDLNIAWERHRDDTLSSSKINEYVNRKMFDRKLELEKSCFGSLSNEEKLKLKEEDKKKYHDKIHRQVEEERSSFEEQYKKYIFNSFCDAQSHLPDELITCFKERREFTPALSDLAVKYNWGLFERKGFEETWGFWLKGEHLEAKDISIENALAQFNAEFATSAKNSAIDDKLVQNPYFYVLKGNEYLLHGKVTPAIAYYDRAIEMDPDFSVNARYNKARALLTYEDNLEKQKCAYEELTKAKEIIATISRPALLTFNTLVSQHQNKIETSIHVQHQLNILSQQENYIDKACQEIAEARKNEYQVKLTTQLISETLNRNDEDHSQAIREADTNGLTYLFTVEQIKPFPWLSILGLALISLTQIAVGCLITVYTGGALGIGLIAEGVSDMITAIKAAIQGGFDWAAWAIEKAISLAVSIICAGFQGIKNSCRAVVNTVKDLFGKTAVGATKDGITLATRQVATELAKGVTKECLTAAGQWCTDKLIIKNLEKVILDKVEEYITESLLKNPLVKKAIELDITNGNNYWQHLLLNEGLAIMQEQEEHAIITIVKGIVEGVVANKVPLTNVFTQIAGMAELFVELTTYTRKFMKEFNTKVDTHQSTIESEIQQVNSTNHAPGEVHEEILSNAPPINVDETDIVIDSESQSEVYSSKELSNSDNLQQYHKRAVSKSSSKYIVDSFKVEITNKLINSVNSKLIDPAISYGVEKSTTAIFRKISKVNDDLLLKVRESRDRRHYTNKFANSSGTPLNMTGIVNDQEHQNMLNESDTPLDSNDLASIVSATNAPINDQNILNESAQNGVDRLKTDTPLDSNDLASIASVTNAPIHVYDKNTRKLVEVVDDELPGKPIKLLHSASNGSDPGHWEPIDKSIHVNSNGSNNCLVDSVFAQLNEGKKQEMEDVNGLKKRLIENIYKNPVEANVAYEVRDQLEGIAPDELRLAEFKVS